MLTLVPDEIERYARDHSDPEPDLLTQLTQVTRDKTDVAMMLIGPLEGNILKTLVALTGGRKVVEVGTFTGYSALWMASALADDGKLITCDINAQYTAIAEEFWGRSPHGSKIELLLGPATETLPRIEGPIDLVFIDADKENYVQYWDELVPKVRAGGILVADNVLWSGRVLDPRPESPADQGIVKFNAHVRADDRVDRVMLTVRDGMLVARKK